MFSPLRMKVTGLAATASIHGALVAVLAFAFVPAEKAGRPAGGPMPVVLRTYDVADDEVAGQASRDALSPHAPIRGQSVRKPSAASPNTVAPPSAWGSAAPAAKGQVVLSPPASAGGGVSPDAYRELLHRHVMQFLQYPAAGNGALGLVRIQMIFDREGAILDAWVAESSGNITLDDAALASLTRAQPLPPIPASLPQTLEVVMPIDFVPQRPSANAQGEEGAEAAVRAGS